MQETVVSGSRGAASLALEALAARQGVTTPGMPLSSLLGLTVDRIVAETEHLVYLNAGLDPIVAMTDGTWRWRRSEWETRIDSSGDALYAATLVRRVLDAYAKDLPAEVSLTCLGVMRLRVATRAGMQKPEHAPPVTAIAVRVRTAATADRIVFFKAER